MQLSVVLGTGHLLPPCAPHHNLKARVQPWCGAGVEGAVPGMGEEDALVVKAAAAQPGPAGRGQYLPSHPRSAADTAPTPAKAIAQQGRAPEHWAGPISTPQVRHKDTPFTRLHQARPVEGQGQRRALRLCCFHVLCNPPSGLFTVQRGVVGTIVTRVLSGNYAVDQR